MAGTLLCQYLLSPVWRLIPAALAALALALALTAGRKRRLRWLSLAAAGLLLGLGWVTG